MEGAMPNHDLEALIQNYRRLTPAEYTLLQEKVAEHAKALRATFLRDVFGKLLSWRRRRSAIAQLNALDDATLKDIGLHRSGIEAAVDNSLPHPKPLKRRVLPEKPHLCLQRTG
jgi:uncharacterized protein YjiS (DUF1127 family)